MSQITAPPAPANVQNPTAVRWEVLLLVCVLSMITYLDRVCFGAAAPLLAIELGLSSVAELKWAFTAFAIAYAVFEIPTGWLGDKMGPRITLIRIVAWWSFFTAVTGMIGMRVGSIVLGGLGTLVVVRFLFGMGEAGAYPNITRAVHNWFPLREWSIAQGFVWMSGRLMGGLTPLVWAILVSGTAWTAPLISWRTAFFLFGCLGVAWCVLFARRFRNTPEQDTRVNEAEREHIAMGSHPTEGHSIPWWTMLTSVHLWLLCIMYFCVSYGWYFNITYLPSFLKNHFEVDDTSIIGALYKGGPLWVGAFGCVAGGAIAEFLSRWLGDRRLARRILCVSCQVMCMLCWLGARTAPSALTFFMLVSGAALFTDLTLGTAWATCQDIGRRFPAVTAGWMNTLGNLGGAASGWITGVLVERGLAQRSDQLGVAIENLSTPDKLAGEMVGFDNAFLSYAAVYAVSACCWFLVDSTTPIGKDSEKAAA